MFGEMGMWMGIERGGDGGRYLMFEGKKGRLERGWGCFCIGANMEKDMHAKRQASR